MNTNNTFFTMGSQPIIIKKELAVKLGLKEAIILQQFFYWLEKSKEKNPIYLGKRYWFKKTVSELEKYFYFWSEKTIRNVINTFKDKQIILAEKLHTDPTNHSMFYSINFDSEFFQDCSMRSLLFDSVPLVLSRFIVKKIGLAKAIVLQQLHYWISYNKKCKKNFYQGMYWTYNTIEKWENEIGVFSASYIKEVIQSLYAEGIILKDNFNKNKFDRTTWYSINYEHKIFTNEIDTDFHEPHPGSLETQVNSDIVKNLPSREKKKKLIKSGFEIDVNSDSVKNLPSKRGSIPDLISNKEYQVKESAHAREDFFAVEDFVLQDKHKLEIVEKEKLTTEQIELALKEFTLYWQAKDKGKKTYNYFLRCFELWCSRFHKLKKTKTISTKKAKKEKTIDERLAECVEAIPLMARKTKEGETFYSLLIEKMGAYFLDAGLRLTTYMGFENGVLCLNIETSMLKVVRSLQTQRDLFCDAVRAFKADLKGVHFYNSGISKCWQVEL